MTDHDKTTVSAVAATPKSFDARPPLARADASSTPTESAEAAGGLGSTERWRCLATVTWLQPVDGWSLCWTDYEHSDGFSSKLWIARGPDSDVKLPVSSYFFTPSQERFAWFVRNNFPMLVDGVSGFTDRADNADIDAAIERDARRAEDRAHRLADMACVHLDRLSAFMLAVILTTLFALVGVEVIAAAMTRGPA